MVVTSSRAAAGVSPRRSGELVGVAGTALVAVAAGVCLALVNPHVPGSYPTCPLFALTGLFCAGCGSMRAVHDLTHLDLAGAWGMNPLLVLVLPFLAASWLAWARRAWTGLPRRWIAPGWAVWVIFGVIVAYSVLRNVPVLAPWLAP